MQIHLRKEKEREIHVKNEQIDCTRIACGRVEGTLNKTNVNTTGLSVIEHIFKNASKTYQRSPSW